MYIYILIFTYPANPFTTSTICALNEARAVLGAVVVFIVHFFSIVCCENVTTLYIYILCIQFYLWFSVHNVVMSNVLKLYHSPL